MTDDARPTPPTHPPAEALEALRVELRRIAIEHLETGRKLDIRIKQLERQMLELTAAGEDADDRLDDHDRRLSALDARLGRLENGVTEVLLTGQAVDRKVDALTAVVGAVAELLGARP